MNDDIPVFEEELITSLDGEGDAKDSFDEYEALSLIESIYKKYFSNSRFFRDVPPAPLKPLSCAVDKSYESNENIIPDFPEEKVEPPSYNCRPRILSKAIIKSKIFKEKNTHAEKLLSVKLSKEIPIPFKQNWLKTEIVARLVENTVYHAYSEELFFNFIKTEDDIYYKDYKDKFYKSINKNKNGKIFDTVSFSGGVYVSEVCDG